MDAQVSTAEQANEPLINLYDANDATFYHSDWNNSRAVPFHAIIDLGESQPIDYLIYRSRDNAGNDNITSLSLEISQDGENWQPVGDVINWTPDNKEKATLLPEGTTARFIKLNWLSSVGSLVSRKELTVMAPAVISEEILIDTPEVDSDDQNLIDEPTDELEDPLPARLLNDSATGIRVQLQEGEEARIVSFRVNRWKTGSPHTPGYPR